LAALGPLLAGTPTNRSIPVAKKSLTSQGCEGRLSTAVETSVPASEQNLVTTCTSAAAALSSPVDRRNSLRSGSDCSSCPPFHRSDEVCTSVPRLRKASVTMRTKLIPYILAITFLLWLHLLRTDRQWATRRKCSRLCSSASPNELSFRSMGMPTRAPSRRLLAVLDDRHSRASIESDPISTDTWERNWLHTCWHSAVGCPGI